MGKKYNLGSSSDMRRLSRDLKNSVMDMTRSAVNDMDFEVECPHCHSHFQAHSGINICPMCLNEVKLNLNIHF